MDVSAQVEKTPKPLETQLNSSVSIDDARLAYQQAEKKLSLAATGSRSQLSLAQQDFSEKKEKLILIIESAIAKEKNKTVKTELIKELNLLNSKN
jgi:hypothetical protein